MMSHPLLTPYPAHRAPRERRLTPAGWFWLGYLALLALLCAWWLS